MTDPFFLETLVASDVLPFERPFLVAHEWSHLAGIADEGEANFVDERRRSPGRIRTAAACSASCRAQGSAIMQCW
jgi:hypothetical protein